MRRLPPTDMFNNTEELVYYSLAVSVAYFLFLGGALYGFLRLGRAPRTDYWLIGYVLDKKRSLWMRLLWFLTSWATFYGIVTIGLYFCKS